ncbi:MAG: HAMP domain-containing histidine kinase [Myxococcales bacterium]|nr:HAMP domain-containing histidine kinase [Myxococcales bacterium]
MKRFAAVDDPIALSQLVDAPQLAELLASVTRLHPVAIGVLDRKGVVFSQIGKMEGTPEHRKALEYSGDIVGYLALSTTGSAEVDLALVAEHVAVVLELLVHSAYARHLTTTIHEAAMEESFSEIGDRNQRLASAVERLEELERLKSNFLATISHELRTPLTSIIGYSEMMVEGLAGDLSGEQSEFIRTILTKAEHLLQLITGILDVSLIEARSLRLSIKPLSLGELLASVASTMQRDLDRREIVLDLPKEAVPHALGDEGKLRQVILQLLANAIKFSPQGGDIRVSVTVGALSPQDNSSPNSPFWRERLSERFGVRVTVEDQGIGVASEQRASIFDPFYQADSSSTRAFGGTGLGLSLAKSYVVAHGGFLWLEPLKGDHASPGSAFTFSLPAVPEELDEYVRRQSDELPEGT